MANAESSEASAIFMRFKGGSVIGHDALDFDAVASEEAQSVTEEYEGGESGFIGHDFGIGQAGMIVHGEVEDFPSGSLSFCAFVALAVSVACDAMSDSVDFSEFFGIDMDHFAGGIFFVADNFWFGVEVFQARQAGALADARDGGPGQTDGDGDFPHGFSGAAQVFDQFCVFLLRLRPQPMRTGGSVFQPFPSFGFMAAYPLINRGRRDPASACDGTRALACPVPADNLFSTMRC